MGVIEGFALEGFFDGNLNNRIVRKNGESTINGRPVTPFEMAGLSFGWSIGTIINIVITFLALYFYFKCNWSKKGKFSMNVSNISDKILGFLVSCCCSICYVAYHLAIPC
jgi:hypothetical protein